MPWTRRTTTVLLVATGLVVLVYAADYVTGSEVSFSLFFLVPVAFATWGAGRNAGIALSAISAAATVVCDVTLHRYAAPPFHVLWHSIVSFGFYALATLAVARLRAGLIAERDLRLKLEGAYEQLDAEMRTVGSIQRSLLPSRALAVRRVPDRRLV